MFGGPEVVEEVYFEDEELEFTGDEVDGGVGEGDAVVAPDLVELFFVGELNGGEEAAFFVVEGDEEGVVLAIGGVLDADEGVDLDEGGAFGGGVVVEDKRDVVPAGLGFVEAEEGGLTEAGDDVFVDALDSE